MKINIIIKEKTLYLFLKKITANLFIILILEYPISIIGYYVNLIYIF